MPHGASTTVLRGFVTHSPSDFTPRIPPLWNDDLEPDYPPRREIGPVPNLIVTATNVFEVNLVRVREGGDKDSGEA